MSKLRKRVYVAGPISSDPVRNTNKALQVGSELVRLGFAPFVPHLTVFWDMFNPQDYEVWMEFDFAWLSVSQALLRIPGESPGSDREVALALSLEIPVFYQIDDLIQWRLEITK